MARRYFRVVSLAIIYGTLQNTLLLTSWSTDLLRLNSRVNNSDIAAGDLVIKIKTESRYERSADMVGSVTVPLQNVLERAYESKRFELFSCSYSTTSYCSAFLFQITHS